MKKNWNTPNHSSSKSRGRRRYRPIVEQLEDRLAPATIAWDGEAGNNNWNDPLNWVNQTTGANTNDFLPGASDDAVIGAAFAADTIQHASGTAAVRSLASEAVLEISAGSFAITANSTINNSLNVSGAATLSLSNLTLSGTGTLTNTATVTFNNSTIAVPLVNQGVLNARRVTAISSDAGMFTTNADSVFRVESFSGDSGHLTVANGFTNNGLIELTSNSHNGNSTLNVTNGTLVNAATANIDVLIGVDGLGNSRFLGAELDNQGTLTIVSRSLTITKASAQHANSGTIRVTGGDLTVTQTGTSPSFSTTGAIEIDAGRTLAVTGGLFNYDAGTITGDGTLSLTSTIASFMPDFSNAQTELVLTSSTLNGPGTLTNVTGLTITSSTIAAPLVNQGELTAQRSNNNINSDSGLFTTNGDSIIRVQSFSNDSGVLNVANGFTNNGLIELTSNSTNGNSTLNVTNGTLVNAAGANIDVLIGVNGGGRTLGAELDNQGTLTIVSQPLTISKASAQHTNSGTINVTGGNLSVTGLDSFTTTGTITIDPARSVTLGSASPATAGALNVNGTTLFAAGNLAFDLHNNSGQVHIGTSPGVLNLAGNYTQNSAATLNLEIGGTADADFDRLIVTTGAAALAGTLRVVLIEPFVPEVGNSFLVLDGATSGAFETLDLPALPFDRAWAAQSGSLTLTVVPTFDFGDAPDTSEDTGPGNYNTLGSHGGPSHAIVAGLRLGANIDVDDGTLQSPAANADDVDQSPNDEDGLVDPSQLEITEGDAPVVHVRATNSGATDAILFGWIDYTRDGVFDNETERAQVTVPAGTVNGIFALEFAASPSNSAGLTFARFRLSTDPAAANPTGAAVGGEVEDYTFTILESPEIPPGVHGIKWHDLNKDGVRDSGEPGLNGWTIELVDANGIVVAAQVTHNDPNDADSAGHYWFEDVAPGTYTVREVEQAGWGQSSPDPLAQSAYALDQSHGLFRYASERARPDELNWGWHGEKWLKSANDDWHYVTPHGELFVWDGQSGPTHDQNYQPILGADGDYIYHNPLNGTLVAMLDFTYYEDLGKLADAPRPGNIIDVIGDIGETHVVDFGNYPVGIHGRKYHDVNADGDRDAGEEYLNDWTIELIDARTGEMLTSTTTMDMDLNGDTVIDPETERGWYWFQELEFNRHYFVNERVQDGWAASAPSGTALDAVAQSAHDLDQARDFYTDGAPWFNWGGQNEKWFWGADLNGDGVDERYYMTANGAVYHYPHSGDFQGVQGEQIGMLDASYYHDLNSLVDVPQPPALVNTHSVEVTKLTALFVAIDFGNYVLGIDD